MKKLFVLFLVLSLIFSILAGCGKEAPEPTTEAPTSEPTTESPTTEAPTTEAPTTEAPTTEAPTTEEPTTEDTDEPGLLGNLNGNTYENPLAGFGCTLDDTWYIYNDAEMAAIMGITTNMFTDENIKSAIDASGTAMIFYAAQNMSMPNLNITVENLGAAASLFTADQYVDAVLQNMEPTLSSAGFTNITLEKITVTFAGEEIPAVTVAAEVAGMQVHELLIPVIRGDYIFNTTICSSTADECMAVLPHFYAVGAGL